MLANGSGVSHGSCGPAKLTRPALERPGDQPPDRVLRRQAGAHGAAYPVELLWRDDCVYQANFTSSCGAESFTCYKKNSGVRLANLAYNIR